MKYTLKVIERHSGIVEVDAESFDEAISKAIDLVDVEFECVEDVQKIS